MSEATSGNDLAAFTAAPGYPALTRASKTETKAKDAERRQMIRYEPRNEARGIAQLMRMGWFRPVHCKSIAAQELRAVLTARKLVQSKLHDIENSLRGILRGFGLKVGKTTGRSYAGGSRTNVAIRPRFGRGAALKRRPLTCRRSATALTAANQRRRSAPDALPGTRLRSRCCLPPPVPVQRQSRRPVMMPAGRISEAAREQDVSSHPREPHPPPRRKHPRGEVLRERMIRR